MGMGSPSSTRRPGRPRDPVATHPEELVRMSAPPYKFPTLEVARQLRAEAERDILARLQRLTAETGLDLVGVEVFLVAEIPRGEDDPRRVAKAVRVELAV